MAATLLITDARSLWLRHRLCILDQPTRLLADKVIRVNPEFRIPIWCTSKMGDSSRTPVRKLRLPTALLEGDSAGFQRWDHDLNLDQSGKTIPQAYFQIPTSQPDLWLADSKEVEEFYHFPQLAGADDTGQPTTWSLFPFHSLPGCNCCHHQEPQAVFICLREACAKPHLPHQPLLSLSLEALILWYRKENEKKLKCIR